MYDTATGLYYLQSRYYDPQCGRFLNPDDVSYLGASGTVLGWNLFTYCENDPVNKVDPTGTANIKIAAITLPAFGNEGRNDASNLKKLLYNKRNTSSYAVYWVNSKESFIQTWNNLPALDVLIILTHGDPTHLWLSQYGGELWSEKEFHSIYWKKIKCVLLLECNVGHQSFKRSNVAYYLCQRISGVVIAPNGQCEVVHVNNKEYAYGKVFSSYYIYRSTHGDSGWKSYLKWYESRKSNIYWVTYQEKNRRIIISDMGWSSIGYSMVDFYSYLKNNKYL